MKYDFADQKDVEARNKRIGLVREQQLADIRKVVSSREGRRFYWRQMSECQIFHEIQESDPIQIAKKIGKRSAGLSLLNDIMAADPEAYLLMMNESREDKEKGDLDV